MSNYATRGRPPTTLTADELARVLRVSGEHVRGFRDHCIISLAVGAGLREHEIAALDVLDVGDGRGGILRRVTLHQFKGVRRATQPFQVVILPDECRRKLERWVKRLDLAPGQDAPLFASRQGERISTRRMRSMWRSWQQLAGLERLHPFHALRHTFGTNAYREAGGDVLAAMRLLRHRRVETTQIYAHVSDEDLERVARRLPS